MNRRIKFLFAAATIAAAIWGCGQKTPVEPQEEPVPQIELVAPQEGFVVALDDCSDVEFEWVAVEGINNYKVEMSAKDDFLSPQSVVATANPLKITSENLDDKLAAMGIASNTSSTIYWRVVPSSNAITECTARTITIKRKMGASDIPYEQRVADPLVVKVAVVYEDPVVPGTGGKLLHEVYHWNDPRKQSKTYRDDFEEMSHGVVKYEIIGEYEADHLFSFFTDKGNDTYMTVEELAAICDTGKYPGIASGVEFDYVGMINYFGFGPMRDKGEVNEIWVYTHPASGMYESRLVGKNAFWCNSPGITTNLPCQDLLAVMFCNFERTVDLAIHSYGHRFESIMNQVYGGLRYEYKINKKALNKWEKFCGYRLNYAKYDEGYSHIGLCHFPPNGASDYDYSNGSYIYTYADEWFDYPYIPENKENARRVNSAEWGRDQYGFMKWYFGHMPHFKGLNTDPNDLHLNNWWYYLVDYNAAMKYERQLVNEM